MTDHTHDQALCTAGAQASATVISDHLHNIDSDAESLRLKRLEGVALDRHVRTSRCDMAGGDRTRSISIGGTHLGATFVRLGSWVRLSGNERFLNTAVGWPDALF